MNNFTQGQQRGNIFHGKGTMGIIYYERRIYSVKPAVMAWVSTRHNINSEGKGSIAVSQRKAHL